MRRGIKRVDQFVLISAFVAFSWLAMQAVHELGHVLGAVVTGGQVQNVVLHPLTFSRTDVDPNPHPLLVVWAGPVLGVILPLVAFGLARSLRWGGIFLFRFFAGFCLVANGAYIGLGAIEGLADAGDMLRHGSARWHLILFGVGTVPLGLFLWHGLGPEFGLGEARGHVSRRATVTSLVLLAITVGVELVTAAE